MKRSAFNISIDREAVATTTQIRGWRTLFFTVAFQLLALCLLALGLRLLVWQWRAAYPPGGDEREYWQQALTLLQHKQYVELQLMRPPLYTVFLAGSIVLFDSVMQNVRLVQVLISALTVVPIYGLTWALFRSRWAAFIGGLLVALNYTLAATATELLTETVFLFGLSVLFWLLITVQSSKFKIQNAKLKTQNSKPLHDLFNFGNFGDKFAQAAFDTHSQSHGRARARTASALQPQLDDRSVNFYQFNVATVCHQVGTHFVQYGFDVN